MSFAFVRFHIPQTKPLSLSKITGQLEDGCDLHLVLSRRNDLAALLRQIGQDTSGKPNNAALIDALKLYIPDAFSLASFLGTLPPNLASSVDVEYSWTSGITRQPEKFYSFTNVNFELAMLLMTLGYAQINHAAQKMQSSLASDLEACKEMAQLLCESCGPYVLQTLGRVCLAQAQEIGATNAEYRKMRDSLVAKLYIHSSEVYKEGQRHLEALLAHPEHPKSEMGLIMEYLWTLITLKSLLLMGSAFRHLGADAKANDSHGLAITYCQLALSKMEEAKHKQKGSSVFSGTQREGLAGAVAHQVGEEEAKVKGLLAKYIEENERIYFDSLPKPDHVNVPPPTQLFSVRPYVPPLPRELKLQWRQKEQSACVVS